MESNAAYYTKKLKGYLDSLEAHDKETRRLLDAKEWMPGMFERRSALREDLVANVVVMARTLVSLPPEAPKSYECAACRDLGEVTP